MMSMPPVYMDLEVQKALRTPEGKQLVDEFGYTEAHRIMADAWIQKYLNMAPAFAAVSVGIAALFIAGLIALPVAGGASAGGVALGGASAGGSVGLSASNLVRLIGSGVIGAGLIERVYRNYLVESPDVAREILSLGTRSDADLRGLGYNNEEIQSIRQFYRDVSGVGGTASLPVTPFDDESSKLASFLASFKTLVNAGVGAGDALRQVSQSMNWSPSETVVNQLYYSSLQDIENMRLEALDKANRQAVSDLRSDYSFDMQMQRDLWSQQNQNFTSLQQGWSIQDRDYELLMQGYNKGTHEYALYERFYSVFDNLRQRGLPPEQAITQATLQTGYRPDPVVIERLLMDAQNMLDEFVGAYQTNDVYTMIQDMLNWNKPEGQNDEFDLVDYQGYGKGSMQGNSASVPNYSPSDFKGQTQTQIGNEENMSYRRRNYRRSSSNSYAAFMRGLRAGRRSRRY